MSHAHLVEVEKAVEDYIEGYSRSELGLSETTIKNKRNLLRRLLKFLGENPLTLETIRAFSVHLSKKGCSPSSRRNYLRIIKAFINFLFIRNYIERNFSSEIVVPKVSRRKLDIIPAEIAEKVITSGTKPNRYDTVLTRKSKRFQRLALQLALRTGLRVSELLSLKQSDINFEEQVITVLSKGGSVDVIPLPGDMVKLLKQQNNGLLFPVVQETLNVSLKRGCRRLHIKPSLTCHSLRHIFCTSMLKAGVPLQIVSRLMRHSSVKITDSVYSHYNIEDLKFTLNSKHPLVRQGMTPEEVLEALEGAVDRLRIHEDNRFNVSIQRSSRELSIRVITSAHV